MLSGIPLPLAHVAWALPIVPDEQSLSRIAPLSVAAHPPELSRLLSARGGAEADEAWGQFLATHSSVLLHTCRTVSRDADAAMDGFACILDALREDGFRRLRGYVPQPGARFTTWLVVVARRLLLDHFRHRYGRSRSEGSAHREEHLVRRRLEDLVAVEIDLEKLATPASPSPDLEVRRQQLAEALRRALEELPPSDRLLLTLRFDDVRPVREIAATMHLPTVFHVYRRLGAALAELKRALARRGVESADP